LSLKSNASLVFRGAASVLLITAAIQLSGCDSVSSTQPGADFAKATPLSVKAELGQKLFFDTALSASGAQSCATCHVPSRAFASDDDLPVQPGGPTMNLTGLRNTPALVYTAFTPPFHIESDGTPVGGFMRDGREPSLASQAQGPFVTPFEMANSGPDEVVARLKSRPYLQDFIDIYGADTLNNADASMHALGDALAAFEKEDVRFHPFSSKYDYWLKGQAQLSAQEKNGLRLFNDPTAGNCAACHSSKSADGTTPPLFTDFSYDNLGVPRNTQIAANDDTSALPYVPHNSNDGVHHYYDLGLCGPLRSDLGHEASLCGAFKVPTLRDIALTAPYFHNGVFNTLQKTIQFYVSRDTSPSQWYPDDGHGNIIKFNDMPATHGGQFSVNAPGSDNFYMGNVNSDEVPYNHRLGENPSLTADDITDVVAFLCTLTDGYDPANPAAYALPSQCPQSGP